jgi:signal transduction histidine kinase/CheY-like chemotaxis protein
MASQQNYKVHEILREIKHNSAIQRLNFANQIGVVLGIISGVSELLTHDILSHYGTKIALIFINLFHTLAPIVLRKNSGYAKMISIGLAELINIILISYAFVIHKDTEMIWIHLSALTIFFYESYLFSDVKWLLLFSLKQTGIWVISGYMFSRISLKDPSSLFTGISGTAIYYFSCCYFEYLKDIEMCKSKLEVLSTNEKIVSIVESIPDSILVITKEINSVFTNSNFRSLLGDKSILQYLTDSKYQRRYFGHNESKAAIIDDFKESFELELGTEISFGITEQNKELTEWKGKIINWEDTVSMILFGKNVSNLIKLEKESSENQYKSALLRTVSHELRTPINAILAMTEMIKSSQHMSLENIERLEIVSGSCSYQLCLINDLLDYAQIIAGCLKISYIPFNVKQLLTECLKLIEIQTYGSSLKLDLVVGEIPETIVSDPYRIKQIILNLLTNAKKFTQKGCILLEALYSNKTLTIKCTDTGIGIPPEKLSILFTQFGRIDNSSSINPHGVGLGLVISNMLVKELGGDKIYVSSELNKGSCFSFSISLDEMHGNLMDIAEENVRVVLPCIITKSLLDKTEILIVDDAYFNIIAISQILKTEGINCSYALNGEDALNKIRNTKFACVLMDCEMPILNGWETTTRIKELYEKNEIDSIPAIIASTAHSSETIKQRCFDCGMDDIMIKPCPRDIMINKIKYWVQKYKKVDM